MDGVGLSEKAKADQKSPKKRTIGDKMGKTRRWRLHMEELGSYEALSVGDDPSGRS